jgi:hypothetical protein
MFQFSARFRALQSEAGLTAQLLGSGATILRTANSAQDGYYSQALFNLSIGLERAAKLILVLDHCIETKGRFPDDAQLRKFGHNIEQLFKATELVRVKHQLLDAEHELPSADIHKAILATLSEFAKSSRYYNLDYLAKGTAATTINPIAAWFSSVGTPILTKHYSGKVQKRDKARAQIAEAAIGHMSSVVHSTEIHTPIDTIAAMFEHGAKTKVIQKWGQFYTLQVIRYVARLISSLSYPAETISNDIPHLIEYFALFLNEDAYLKSRKTWSPYQL